MQRARPQRPWETRALGSAAESCCCWSGRHSSSFQTRDTTTTLALRRRLHDSLMQCVDTVGHSTVDSPDGQHT